MKAELSRSYISVRRDGCPSYGGSQNWFGGMLRVCGCGVIGAADILWYLEHDDEMTLEEYDRYVRRLRRSFVMIPFRGIPGFMMAFCLDLCMRRRGLPYRVRWGAGRGGIRKTAAAMIRDDIPVPFCIGACLHQLRNKPLCRGLRLCRKAGEPGAEQYIWTKTVRNHFMVMTGIEGKWARISSWGQEYYIDLEELEKLSKGDMRGIFTNMIRIRRIREK